MIDFLKYKSIYFSFSFILVAVSVFALVKWGFNLGVDFEGGSLIEYRFDNDISTENLSSLLTEKGFFVSSIQTTSDGTYIIKMQPVNEQEKIQVEETISEKVSENFEELKFENVGPTIGAELTKKTLYAIVLAASAILAWVAYQFKSFKYGTVAVIAMFHDVFILLGIFSIFGHLYGAEVDFLFITALLTTLSFSVHDTIVVFDRIREIVKKEKGEIGSIANKAVNETMVRSLNNSFTIIFMLVALILMGGSTIKWFAVALLTGTILGTYSSPFLAVPVLVVWDELFKKLPRIKSQK
jgi:preprotein translocase subunit SecF